jgi:transcriptional regulator with XRE-family HTH domain
MGKESFKFSEFLKRKREDMHLSVEQMANRCNMPCMMYKSFEEGTNALNDYSANPLLVDFARGLNMHVDEICRLTGKKYF